MGETIKRAKPSRLQPPPPPIQTESAGRSNSVSHGHKVKDAFTVPFGTNQENVKRRCQGTIGLAEATQSKKAPPRVSHRGEAARLLQTKSGCCDFSPASIPSRAGSSQHPSIPSASGQPRRQSQGPGAGTPRGDPSRLVPRKRRPDPDRGERPAAGRGRAVPSAALSGSWCRAGSWPRPTRCCHRGSSRRSRAVTAAGSGGLLQRSLLRGSGGCDGAAAARASSAGTAAAALTGPLFLPPPSPDPRPASQDEQPRPSQLLSAAPPPRLAAFRAASLGTAPSRQSDAPVTPPSAPAANEWRRPIAGGESTTNLRAS